MNPNHTDNSTYASPIRIILVDDHLLFRIGLRTTLIDSNPPIKIVGEAESAKDFFKLLENVDADLVLLDIVLPDLSGIEIAQRLKNEYPKLKILVISAESNTETICNLMKIGIEGFISKSVSLEELCRAIDYVSSGAEYFGRDIARIIHDIKVAKGRFNIIFTERENEIICLCTKGMTGKEIAQTLNISLKTVEAHKNNIFKKLGISNSVELVRYAIENNIIRI